MRGLRPGFLCDTSGNFALLTSILAIPMLFAAGYMIDLSTITRTKAELQQALDAAVLAAAREGKDITEDQATDIARSFLVTNFDPAYTKFRVVKNGTRFEVQASTKAKMAFGGLLGYSSWPIAAKATADIAYDSYEIALVLDTTGSMAGGKLSSMKDAVLGLIDTMSAQVNDEDKLKFAMVPFATFVNVGPQYGPKFDEDGAQVAGTGAKWLDLYGKVDVSQVELDAGASRFQLYANLGQAWPGCVETRDARGTDLDIDDAAADQSRPETLYIPAFGIDEPDTRGFSNSYIKSSARPNDPSILQKKARWKKYGVATDLAGNPLNNGLLSAILGLLLDPLVGHNVVPIDDSHGKGPGRGCDMQPITPLTSDYKDLKSKVGKLVAAGTTNIMEGVSWGNRVLSPGEPFDEGTPARHGLRKIMIVLTDGSNVLGNSGNDFGSSYSSFGYLVDGRLGLTVGGSSATNTAMNARTLAACTNAKDSGVEIYAIRLEEPNVATGAMLKECASGEDHFLDVPNRSQLDDAFKAIKENIARVRISS